MEKNKKTDFNFIKKLFVRLAFDDSYTLEEIQNSNQIELQASVFL